MGRDLSVVYHRGGQDAAVLCRFRRQRDDIAPDSVGRFPERYHAECIWVDTVNTLEPPENIATQALWTPAKVAQAASFFYPLCESGPLCPLLDDEEVLYAFYVQRGLRQAAKRFCKAHQWPGKPDFRYAISDRTLKTLLRSMCNSPDARRALSKSKDGIALHSAIWTWLVDTNPQLFAVVSSLCHRDKAGRFFITSSELTQLLDRVGAEEDSSTRRPLLYLTLAFAMLEPECRHKLIAVIALRYPDDAYGLGLPSESLGTEGENTKSPPDTASIEIPAPLPSEAIRTSPRSVPRVVVKCSSLYVDDLFSKTEALGALCSCFAGNAGRLAELKDLTAFANPGDAISVLSALDSQRQEIHERSNALISSLTLPCAGHDDHTCQMQPLVREIRGKPASTTLDLIASAEAIAAKANDLLAQSRAAGKELRKLNEEATELSTFLQRQPPPAPLPDSETSSCDCLARLAEQRQTLAALRKQCNVEILKRRDALDGECQQLSKQYDLEASSHLESCQLAYAQLRSRIATAESIGDVDHCAHLLREFETMCDAAERLDYRKIARRLQSDPTAFDEFLNLCRSLLDQDAPAVAYLLLHLRQDLYPFEEIAEVSDQALSILLESACAAACGALPVATVWNTLCANRWLLSIEHGDIESPDLHERVVVALLGAAIGGYTDQVAAMIVRISASGPGRHRLPDALEATRQAIIARRPIQISTPGRLAEKLELERGLLESIAYEKGKYRHLQCGNARHFARFEAVQVFPALSNLWATVSSDIRALRHAEAQERVNLLNINEWYAELVRESDRQIDDHPHYSGKIRAFMQSFVTRLQEYVSKCEDLLVGAQLVIVETDLLETLRDWAGNQPARLAVENLLSQTLRETADRAPRPSVFWKATALAPSIVLRCPNFITWVRAQLEPAPALQVEQLLLKDLAQTQPIAETIRILTDDGAWQSLSILPATGNFSPDPVWRTNHQRDLTELNARRNDVLVVNDRILLAAFDSCIEEDRFPAARQILETCGEQEAIERERHRKDTTAFVDEKLRALNTVKDAAASANMPDGWSDEACRLAGKVEMQLRRLKLSEDMPDAIANTQVRLARAVDALDFAVLQQTRVFDEVEYFLRPSPLQSKDELLSDADKKLAREKCLDLHVAWDTLREEGDLDEQNLRRAWLQFVKEFAKACNLYYDEHDEKRRFTIVQSLKYVFPVYATTFYKPQSEFLKRPLRLYLYRQHDVDIPALQRLEVELSGEDAAASLHIVFAPQGFDRIKRYFRYDTGFKDFLLVDEEFLYRLSLSEKHDVPVRQALHASVGDLAGSTPFVAQGYCHQSNNIYVGRRDVLQKLQNTPQAMIWGGRRIGKTSVLHALESSLRKRGYRVAYIYVDMADDGDPDIAIAQKLASTLGLPTVDSIQDFERQITALRATGARLAFLIDEVDEYIKKSRQVHRDGFPLATTLRQLVMDDSAKDTVLVYSGYHQLYYEARLNSGKRRVGHPFINTLQDIPIRNLSHDEIRELVTTGFEEMMDIEVSPDVPRRIFRRASGHPAFVQQFCRCLLERVSKRRSPRTRVTITVDDVEAVYAANVPTEGCEPPFIFYVDETLGYNLSHLGRAVMLTICDLLGSGDANQDEGQVFSIRKVNQELDLWCDAAEVEQPTTQHFEQTVELLEMTSMLTRSSGDPDEYRVTYPTYVDILRRLDKLGRAPIENSLQSYNSKERVQGVLL